MIRSDKYKEKLKVSGTVGYSVQGRGGGGSIGRPLVRVSFDILAHDLPGFTSIIPATFIADASTSQFRFCSGLTASQLLVHLSHL
jgi:hypothetical protein